MASGLLNQYQVVKGPDNFPNNTPQTRQDANHFLQRCIVAAVTAAVAIAAEATNTADHVNRVHLAMLVLNSPENYALPFAFALAGQGIDNSSTDAQINNMIASVWNGLAGVP